MRYEIRRKEFPFSEAPDLTGREDAAYVPAIMVGDRLEKGPRFGRAIDAAVEAARMCHEAISAGRISMRAAYVGCDHSGERPKGAMKGFVYVSYRMREGRE